MKLSETRYKDLYDLVPVGYLTISEKGLILEANRIVATMLGVPLKALIKQPLSKFIASTDQDIFYLHIKQHLAKQISEEGVVLACELRIVRADSVPIWVQLSSAVNNAVDGGTVIRIALSDVTEKTKITKAKEVTTRVVMLVNTTSDLQELMGKLTTALQEWSGCEAVGIRMKDGDDFPYYETRGFPPQFVQMENRLCQYGADGKIVRDGAGDPILECMCGNVLCGRFDPSKPFFTSRGSFWSNNTTALLASTTDADRQTRTRNRCNGEGYESVALISLRHIDQVLGLLQFNDHHTDRFTADMIAVLENIADSLAMALSFRKANEALRDSEAKHSAMISNISDVIAIMGVDGVIKYKSPNIEKWFGWQPQDLVGTDGWATVHPDDIERIKKEFFTILQKDKSSTTVEYRYKCKDGNYKPIELSAINLVSDPTINGVLMNYCDITDRKKSEMALIEETALFDAQLNSSGDGILIVNAEGKKLIQNQRTVELWKIPQHIADNPDDKQQIDHVMHMTCDPKKFVDKIAYLYGHPEETSRDEVELIDGTILDRYTAPVIGKDGRNYGRLWIFHDITYRKRAEQIIERNQFYLTKAQEIGKIGSFSLDPVSNHVEGSAELFRIFDVAPDQPLFEAFANSVHSEDGLLIFPFIDRLIKEGIPYDVEHRVCHRDGTVLHVHAKGEMVNTSQGRRMIGTVQDITADKQQEQRERELREKLERAARMESLGVLAGGVAHDLNNVLGPIVLLPDIVTEYIQRYGDTADPDYEDTMDAMRIMKESAKRAVNVVSDLVVMGRRGQFQQMPMDVNKAIEQMLSSKQILNMQATRPDVHVTSDLAEEPMWSTGSDSRLIRVLANLVGNAIEAIDGQGDVVVRTRRQVLSEEYHGYEPVPAGEYVVVEVEDTGDGMDGKTMARIFEPFFSTKSPSERSGSGLGLSVVHGLVRDHAGFIDVHSQLGRGTTFAVYLPAAESGEIKKTSQKKPLPGGNERILVIDDEKGQQFIARKQLKKLGYETTIVASGEEAVELFEKARQEDNASPFDLVLVDMIMKGLNGMETCKAVWALYPEQKLMIVSGHAPEGLDEAAKAKGIGWLAKPYSAKELADAVRAAFGVKIERGKNE